MTVKWIPLAYLFSAALLSCKGPAQDVHAIVLSDNTPSQAPATDTMRPVADTIEADMIASWNAFNSFDGRYPNDIDLFEKEPLKSRFVQLLSRARQTFMERFKVTPPVEVEDRILFDEGYMPGKSGYDEAAVAVDMDHDVIYLGIAVNRSLHIFSENGDTNYPQKFRIWMKKFD